MSDEQAAEVIHLRHRLRTMLALASPRGDAREALERFRSLSEQRTTWTCASSITAGAPASIWWGP